MSIAPKAIQDLLDELEASSKAGCALGMFAETSLGSFRERKHRDPPPPAQKTFDAEGEALEHRGHMAHPLLWRNIDEWNLKKLWLGNADCHPFTIGVYGCITNSG